MLVFEMKVAGKNKRDIIKQIREIENKYQIKGKPGFYAFYRYDRIVYIGQSIHVTGRLQQQHHILYDKIYGRGISKVRFLIIENEELALNANLKITESYMISMVQPTFNGQDKYTLIEDRRISYIAGDVLQLFEVKRTHESELLIRFSFDSFKWRYLFTGTKHHSKGFRDEVRNFHGVKPEVLIDMYTRQHLSFAEIGRRINWSAWMVKDRLRYLGVV